MRQKFPEEIDNEGNDRYHADGDDGVKAVYLYIEEQVERQDGERYQGDGHADGNDYPFNDVDVFMKENERPGEARQKEDEDTGQDNSDNGNIFDNGYRQYGKLAEFHDLIVPCLEGNRKKISCSLH